jgi:hypothetical protein
MTTATRLAEVNEVDRFLADPKFLTEGLPHWREGHITGRLTAQWPIVDSDGVLREGTRLVFVCKVDDLAYLSTTLLLRGNRIYGVDLVPASVGKTNGPAAKRLGLPPRVSGSHFHQWDDNRDHALAAGLGGMPYRRPTPRALTRLPHALAALAQPINLTLTPEQASFDVPPQGHLRLGGFERDDL